MWRTLGLALVLLASVSAAEAMPVVPNPFGFDDRLALRTFLLDEGVIRPSENPSVAEMIAAYQTWLAAQSLEVEATPPAQASIIESAPGTVTVENDLPDIPNPFGFAPSLALRSFLMDAGAIRPDASLTDAALIAAFRELLNTAASNQRKDSTPEPVRQRVTQESDIDERQRLAQRIRILTGVEPGSSVPIESLRMQARTATEVDARVQTQLATRSWSVTSGSNRWLASSSDSGSSSSSPYIYRPSSNGMPKTVHVRAYYRKDGTYVRSHMRSAPRR